MSLNRAVIFVNGEIPSDDRVLRIIQPDDYFIAADGGVKHLLRLQIIPNIVVGDLDSITASMKDRLSNQKVEFKTYPPEKEATDLELALQTAYDKGFQEFLVVAALGGRVDQMLGNLSLLINPRWENCHIVFDDGKDQALIIKNEEEIRGKNGDVVSLIPWMDDAIGVSTSGLQYPLQNETLWRYETRGISNVLVADSAEIKIEKGSLLCIHSRKDNE